MTLAAHAFTSIVPLMIVVSALRPDRSSAFGNRIAQVLGLSDDARSALAGAAPAGSALLSSVGALGILVTLVSGTSFARATERIYLRIWHEPRASIRSAWRWLATVGAVVLATALVGVTRTVVAGPWRGAAAFVVQTVVWSVVWTFVPWVLLERRLGLRTLAATGLLTALGLAVLGWFGGLYLPITLSSGFHQFGVLGMVFAYLGWLFALSVVVVATAVIGHCLTVDDGPVGAALRGGRSIPAVAAPGRRARAGADPSSPTTDHDIA